MVPSIPLPKQPLSHPTTSSSSSSKETNHSARKTQAVAKRAIESPREQNSSRAEETLRSLRPQLSDLLQNLNAVQAHLKKYELEFQNDARDVAKNIEEVERLLSSIPSSKRARVEPPSDEETEEPRSPQTRSRSKKYLSVDQVAQLVGISSNRLYYAARSSYVESKREGVKWLIDLESAQKYAEKKGLLND